MRIRNLLSGTVLAISAALLAACSADPVAPAATPVASFARNPVGSPDRNNSCEVEGGARRSKNEKNQCGGGGGGGGGVPTSFSGFTFFYQNTVLSDGECAQYATLCQDAKNAAGGAGNIRQFNIDIHGGSGSLGAPVIPFAGFNPALLTKVAFHSFADGTESLVVTPGAGFYYTSIYWWTAYIANPGFAPTSFFDPNFTVSDPAGPKGSHYVSVTYNGAVYNYLILSQN